MFFHTDPHLVGTKAPPFMIRVGSKRLHISPFVPVQSGRKKLPKYICPRKLSCTKELSPDHETLGTWG